VEGSAREEGRGGEARGKGIPDMTCNNFNLGISSNTFTLSGNPVKLANQTSAFFATSLGTFPSG